MSVAPMGLPLLVLPVAGTVWCQQKWALWACEHGGRAGVWADSWCSLGGSGCCDYDFTSTFFSAAPE